MQFNILFLLAGTLIFLNGGCKVFRNTEQSKEEFSAEDTLVKEISEDKQLEYKYKFIEATKLRLLGNRSDALELLTDCAEIRPHAPAPYYQMSLIAKQMNELDEAVKYGEKAVKYDPHNKWYRIHLANIYLNEEALDSAMVQYESLVNFNDVHELDVLFRLAQLYQKNNKYQQALEYYKEIEKSVGINERISELKKMIYVRIGEKEKAYEEIQKLVDSNPNDARYYGMLAELYATFEEYDKAEKMYDKLFEIDSTYDLGQVSLVKFYNKKGQTDRALDIYTHKVIPNSSVDFRNKMLIFMSFLQEQKQFSQYFEGYERALDSLGKYYPENDEVHALYADLYLKSNKFEKAAEHLKILSESSNTKFIYWNQLLSIYSYLGKFEQMYHYGQKAIEKFEREPRLYLLTSIGAIQMDKPDKAIFFLREGMQYITNDKSLQVQFYTQLGEAYHQTENYEQSDRYFLKVLELDPDNKLVLNNYSYYLSLRGEQLKKALGYSHKVIQSEPNNPVYLDTYSWILYKMGKYQKAHKYIKIAMENGGNDDPDLVEHYGDILFKMGNEEKAFEIWKQAKKLGRSSDQLDYKLKHKALPDKPDEH